jgi:hypothetical protein
LKKQPVKQNSYYLLMIKNEDVYSVLKLFTGFAIAAFIARELTLINAITIDTIPPTKNNHQLNSILYAKFSSHLCMKYQASGVAITKAIAISHTANSFENNYIMFDAVAPKLFLYQLL